MDIQDVLRILKNGAEKPKDDLNDYTKGKRDGQVQAYSHAWTLVKNLSISGVSKRYFLFECTNADKQKVKKLIIAPDRETAISDIETNYPYIIKWYSSEELNVC